MMTSDDFARTYIICSNRISINGHTEAVLPLRHAPLQQRQPRPHDRNLQQLLLRQISHQVARVLRLPLELRRLHPGLP